MPEAEGGRLSEETVTKLHAITLATVGALPDEQRDWFLPQLWDGPHRFVSLLHAHVLELCPVVRDDGPHFILGLGDETPWVPAGELVILGDIEMKGLANDDEIASLARHAEIEGFNFRVVDEDVIAEFRDELDATRPEDLEPPDAKGDA
jgi:hypothetical protein